MPTLSGTSGNDILTGTDDADTINGLGGDDTIRGGLGADQLNGGAGDDTFIFTTVGSGAPQPRGRIDGGEGVDTLNLTQVVVGGAETLPAGAPLQIGNQFYDVISIERFLLGNGNDDLTLTTQTNDLLVHAGGGDDRIIGGSGLNTIYGGLGDDSLGGGVGATLFGEEGDDDLRGGNSANLDGGSGNDTLLGGDNSVLTGGAGDDLITGGAHSWVNGGEGDDSVIGGDRSRIDGGAGNDVLSGGVGSVVYGGTGVNVLSGLAGATLVGGDEGDTFRNSGGAVMIGGAGNDRFSISAQPQFGQSNIVLSGRIDGGLGFDTVIIDNPYLNFFGIPPQYETVIDLGAEVLQFNIGGSLRVSYHINGIENITVDLSRNANASVIGSDSDNVISSEAFSHMVGRERVLTPGSWTVDGGGGNDTIYGQYATQIRGGSGDDMILGDSAAFFDGGSGIDTLVLTFSTGGVRASLETQGFSEIRQGILEFRRALLSIENLTGTNFDDALEGDGGNNILDGGSGNDLLTGGLGNDTIVGGGGVDIAVFAGRRSDSSFSYANSAIAVAGASGSDSLQSIETLQFADGLFDVRSDGTVATSARVTFSGAAGADIIRSGDSNDFLSGGAGHDSLDADVGNDRLDGGTGNDLLTGGAGDDAIDGGIGTDTAVFLAASTQVTFSYMDGAIVVDGPDGRDVLRGIEQLRFSDRVLDVGSDGRVILSFNGIAGTAGADTLTGTTGSDIITGNAGNDTLRGQAASDRLDGGDGVDTAVYSGVRRQYGADSAAVRGGPEGGTDTLVSIEQLQFVDGILSFDVDGIPAQVMRLYDAALDRLPDQAGLEVQVQAIASGANTLAGLAQAFIASPEFQGRYGNLSDRAFVEQLYRFCLNRDGDEPGIQAQVQALQGGLSRGQLLINFSESAEHRTVTQATLSAGLWVPDAEALQIARLYDATFDRLPDAAGLAGQLAALDGGVTLLQLAANFAASPEFQARYGNLSDRAFVEQLYRFCLDREGDEPGIVAQVQALQSGLSRAQLLLNFSESAEHVSLTAPLWSGGIRTVDAPFSGSLDQTPAQPKSGDDGPQTLVLAEVDGAAKPDQTQILPSQPTNALYDPADLGLKPDDLDAFVLPALSDDLMPWIPVHTLPDLLTETVARIDKPLTDTIQNDVFADIFATGPVGLLHRIEHEWA